MGRGSTARANNRATRGSQAPTQFEPAYPPNIKRSLSKNDVELAALTKLHIALRTLKSAIVTEFGDEVLVECVLNEKKELLALAGSSGGVDKSKKINDGTPANISDDMCSIIDTLDEPQQKRLNQLSTAFLLRMKLRRRLLNRLARRLHRVAHVLDGGIQITAPLPPTYGDAVRTYITTESEKSGVALKVLETFDNVEIIRESDVTKFVTKEDERKEILAKLSEQRKKRLGMGVGVDGDDDEVAPDDSMNVEPKSELDLLLKCDEEDKPLLDKLVTYEPGYDKVYTTGPPPLPAVSSSSPSKKSKSSPSKSKGKDKSKNKSSSVVDKGPSSPSSATSTAKDVSSPSSKQSSTAAKEDQINVTKPIASTIDDHEVDEEGEFLQTQDGIMKRLTFSLHGGQSQRAMHPGDRVSEWKRWTKEMCDRIPDQVTYDELGVGGVGMVFDLEGRVKRKRDYGSEKPVAAHPEEDNRGKGKVLKRNSPEKAKDNGNDDKDKDGDVTMSDAANDSKEAKSEEKEEEEADKEKDESKVSTKIFSVTPIPSFHYMDLKRIANHQAELVRLCDKQSSEEIIAKAQVVYDETYALSVQLQKDIAAGKEESQKMHVQQKQKLDAIANTSMIQATDARSHWASRQAKLNQMKEELGEEQAFVKNVCNDVIQDLKDRVCIRVPDMNDQTHSGLGSKRLEMEALKARTDDDANRDAAANVLGHMIDTVDRRHNDMLADYDKFVQPKISDDRTTIADPNTGQTVEQRLKVQRIKMAARIAKMEADFADAEKKRGEAWAALTKAKSIAGQKTKQQSRSRKSTSSSYIPVQQQQQQQMMQQQRQMMQQQQMQAYQQQMRQQAYQQQQQISQPTRQPTAEEINLMMGLGYQHHQVVAMTPSQIQYYIQSQNQRAEQGYLQRQFQAQVLGVQPVSRRQPAAAQPSAAAAVESSATSVAGSQGSVGADGEPKKKYASVYGDKYSSANVKARHNPDGSVIPASAPKMLSDGSFAKPSGRQRKGCDWDSVRGVWVPIPNYQDGGVGSSQGGGDQI